MSVATALVAANEASPQLVEEAVGQALARAGLSHAEGVLLFLTPDFARHAGPAVLAASRRAQSMQVAGAVVAGVASEAGWVFDRPACVAMVFGGPLRLDAPRGHGVHLAMAGASTLPPQWGTTPPRAGVLFSDALSTRPTPAWQLARPLVGGGAEVQVSGAAAHIGVSTGVRQLGDVRVVSAAHGHDLWAVDGRSAADSLRQALPAEYRTGLPLPLHLLALLPVDEGKGPRHPPRLIPLVAANPDGSLTVGEPLAAGQRIAWAIRQPVAAEADMRAVTAEVLDRCGTPPAFGLYFSCIGRGPYFYGGEDRDWLALRDALPGMPLLGVYGSGQIAPYGSANHLLHSAVVLALYNIRTETGTDVHP